MNTISESMISIDYLQGFQIINIIVTRFVQDLQGWSEGFTAAVISKELSSRFFSPEKITKALYIIKEQARHKGLESVCSSMNDVLSEHLSFLVDRDGLFLIIHIPLARAATLTMYRFVDAPFVLDSGHVAHVILDDDILATNEQASEYALLKLSDLSTCTERKNTFLCPYGVTQRNIKDTCLGAFFVGHSESIIKHCKMKIIRMDLVRESLIQISGDEVMVFPPPQKALTVSLVCPMPEQTYTKVIRGPKIMRVHPHCVLNTDNYIFTPSNAFDIKNSYTIRPVLGINPLKIEIGDLRKMAIFDPHFVPDEEINELERSPAIAPHHISLIVVYILVIIIVGLLTAGGLYIYCRFKKITSLEEEFDTAVGLFRQGSRSNSWRRDQEGPKRRNPNQAEDETLRLQEIA
jgi:hypothetical protein